MTVIAAIFGGGHTLNLENIQAELTDSWSSPRPNRIKVWSGHVFDKF